MLLVCGEKFSDKIGTVRPSRMIFGDGAAAFVIGPAAPGEQTDIEVLQTYAGGPVSEVNSIIWPNPEFDNNITVYGPEVTALAGRYLEQMIDELAGAAGSATARHPPCWTASTWSCRTRRTRRWSSSWPEPAGCRADQLYFNIETVGNTSAASIPIAIADAKTEGVIKEPMRIFAPGFGAGAVGGYAVLRVDPAVIAPESAPPH